MSGHVRRSNDITFTTEKSWSERRRAGGWGGCALEEAFNDRDAERAAAAAHCDRLRHAGSLARAAPRLRLLLLSQQYTAPRGWPRAAVAVAVVAAAGRFLFLASDYDVRTGYMCGACGSDRLAVLERVRSGLVRALAAVARCRSE
jgi:hypothetical protein